MASDVVGGPGAPRPSPWVALRAQRDLEKERERAARDPLGQGLTVRAAAASSSATADEDGADAVEANPLAAHAHALWSGMLSNVKQFIELPEDQKAVLDHETVAEERQQARLAEIERERQAATDARYATPSALLHRSSGASGAHVLRGLAPPDTPNSAFTDATEESGAPSLLHGLDSWTGLGSSLANLLSPPTTPRVEGDGESRADEGQSVPLDQPLIIAPLRRRSDDA